ncbi:hypothetical protein FDUTEX481_01416 [Tolypothrix sp. PCC 7601]|nr:hypothetical protein FDUTEX481_01416 [Tolypothrix sp. PCC 7601]
MWLTTKLSGFQDLILIKRQQYISDHVLTWTTRLQLLLCFQ